MIMNVKCDGVDQESWKPTPTSVHRAREDAEAAHLKVEHEGFLDVSASSSELCQVKRRKKLFPGKMGNDSESSDDDVFYRYALQKGWWSLNSDNNSSF